MIMGVHIEDNRLLIIAEPKTVHFNLSKDVDRKMKYETDFITKHDELLAEYAIKNEISQLFSKYKDGKDIYEHGKQ